MKKKKQLSRKAYNILSWINAILLIVTILMFLAGLGGEGYWVHFGVTAGVYVVWAFVFSRFDLNEEDKKKIEEAKAERIKIRQKQEKNKKAISIIKESNDFYYLDNFIEKELERIKTEGFIMCNKKEVDELIEALKDNYNKNQKPNACPFCGGEIGVVDGEYTAEAIVHEAQEVKGVYVSAGYSGRVTRAYEHVDVRKEFPATKYHCPHCEWMLFIAAYKNLENVEYTTKDEEGYYTTSGYDYITRLQTYFSRGKIYDKLSIADWSPIALKMYVKKKDK